MTAQPTAIPFKAAEKSTAKPPYELICSTAHLLKRLGMELKEAYREAFDHFEIEREDLFHNALHIVPQVVFSLRPRR